MKGVRLGIVHKLLALCLVFGLPIAVMLVLLTRAQLAEVAFTEKEIVGNAFQRPLEEVMAHLSRHRQLWAWGKSSSPAAQAALAAEAQAIHTALAHVEAAERTHGDTLEFTREGLERRSRSEFNAQGLTRKWSELERLRVQASPPEIDSAYRGLFRHVRTMITHAGDISNLILDPDLDSYYLMDVTLLTLPQMEDRAQEGAAHVERLLSANRLSEKDRTDLATLAAFLEEADWARAEASARTALFEDPNFYGASSTLAPALSSDLLRCRTATATLVGSLRALAAQPNPADFDIVRFRADERALEDALFDFHHVALNEEDTLLRTRIASLLRKVRLGFVLTGISGLIAAILAGLLASNIVRRVRRIAAATDAFARGELEARVGDAGTDELGQLARSFDVMTDRIGGLTREVSDRAEELARMNHELEGTVNVRTHELREAADFLREIYRAMPGALLVFNAEGRVKAVNQAALGMLGYTEVELIGKPMAELFDGQELEALERPASVAPGADDVVRAESSCKTKGEAIIPVLLSTSALRADVPSAQGKHELVCVALDIRDRRRLEVELRQAQKLESVGRLAAGVAHEINTPIQFVNDNVHFVRDAMNDLSRLLDAYGELRSAVADGRPSRVFTDQVSEVEEAADLDYLRENVPRALERSIEGLERVAAIVRSMKEFAHPDLKEMAPVDLNRAIASTLVIAKNEYKLVADVSTDFGEIPQVTCLVGEMNQVILNIVVNAAHAIGDVVSGTEARGLITVRTRAEGDSVVISIADTGGGIPSAVASQIFDPFFTTKEVGRGTGQGLAIARSVVCEKHGGELTFETELGRGTTFVIRLPIAGRQNEGDRAAA
jgi:PAS domain S-box-containing protein